MFFDTEYTSWEGSEEREWCLEWESREIVQIGAVSCSLGDDQWHETGVFTRLVKPVRNPLLSTYFIKLTGITQESVEREGVGFDVALFDFVTFADTKADAYFSWGDEYEIIHENTAIPFRSETMPFFDVRPIFDAFGFPTQNLSSGSLYGTPNRKTIRSNSLGADY